MYDTPTIGQNSHFSTSFRLCVNRMCDSPDPKVTRVNAQTGSQSCTSINNIQIKSSDFTAPAVRSRIHGTSLALIIFPTFRRGISGMQLCSRCCSIDFSSLTTFPSCAIFAFAWRTLHHVALFISYEQKNVSMTLLCRHVSCV